MDRNGNRMVKYKGKWYDMATHAHTHPQMAKTISHPIGLSKRDLDFQKFIGKPIHILYNKKIYSVNGTYNSRAQVWDYKYIGTW
jgi:hypothetical protein